MSRRPSCASTRSNSAAISSSLPPWQAIAIALPPLARIDSATRSSASCRRDDSTTVAPRSAKARAMHSPMPRLAPLMVATLPSRPKSTIGTKFLRGSRSAAALALQLFLGHRLQMHLVRPVRDAQRAVDGPVARQRKVLAHTAAAVHLDRAIEHAQRHVRRGHLDPRDLLARFLVAHGVHEVGGMEHEQTGLIDLDARPGDVLADRAHLGEGPSEGDARLHPRAEVFE